MHFTSNFHGKILNIHKNLYLNRVLILLICLTFSSSIISSCSRNTHPTSVSGFKLNTYITITVYDKVDPAILERCLSICDTYENMFSRTITDSTLSQLNNHNTTTVPDDLGRIIEYGLNSAKISNGSFDITIGSVSSLWDFTSENPSVPDKDAIKQSLPYVGYKNVSLQKNNDASGTWTVLIPEGTIIDLGAVAKGYIADRLKEYLISSGVKSAIINLGGNILCVGSKPDRSDFSIGVKKPFSESEVMATLKINGKSVVSSGIYERCFTSDGILYHHILNPFTGYPYNNSLTSVTIISDSSVDGDCLSTTCFTLGLDKGMELIEQTEGTEAIFVTSDGSMHYSSGASK